MYQGRSHTPAPANGTSFKLPIRVSASKTSGQVAALRYDGKEGSPVIVEISRLHVRTRNTSGACTLDVGVAANGTTSSDTILDGVSVAGSNTVYDNISDHGTNGLTRQLMTVGQYFTASVASGDANGLVADVYVNIQTLQGGNP